MTDPRILLTGFGPFPGVPHNASANLIARLAAASPLPVETLVLPTEWARGPAELEAALARVKPDIALHFGVSERARGFVIEEQGVNACDARADACGSLPVATRVCTHGPDVHRSTFPVPDILAALTRAGLPAARSHDAGGYLCNAVLYTSLASPWRAPLTGFIHIPAHIRPGAALDAAEALTGARLILETCLAAHQGLLKT